MPGTERERISALDRSIRPRWKILGFFLFLSRVLQQRHRLDNRASRFVVTNKKVQQEKYKVTFKYYERIVRGGNVVMGNCIYCWSGPIIFLRGCDKYPREKRFVIERADGICVDSAEINHRSFFPPPFFLSLPLLFFKYKKSVLFI